MNKRLEEILARQERRAYFFNHAPLRMAAEPLAKIRDIDPDDIQWLLGERARLVLELKGAKAAMEGVLLQVGYTCMSAYEEVEGLLGVNWDKEKDCFVYPDGKPVTGEGRDES